MENFSFGRIAFSREDLNMSDDAVIKVDRVSKKFAKSINQSMMYGIHDIARNLVHLSANSEKLRTGEFWAVDDVSFELKKGEVLGLIGKNGSGKSTMLKMLNGIYMPDKGNIKINGKVGALIEVGAGFHPLLSGRENIYVNGSILGMSKKEIDNKFADIVQFADIGDFIDSPVRNYSSGMYVRLGFSIAVHSTPEILLVDEVLAVGDLGFQAKCLNKIGEIRKKGTSIILVTHNMHTLSAFADKAVLFNDGKIKYHGDVSKAIEQYTDIFTDGESEDSGIEKVVTSTDEFRVLNVEFLPSRKLNPGDSFTIKLEYESKIDLNNIEIDILMREKNSGDRIYFQATNRSFDKVIDLKKGNGTINIVLNAIPINNSIAIISIAIWKDKRSQIIFWWRNIKVSFNPAALFSGENYLNVSYEIN